MSANSTVISVILPERRGHPPMLELAGRESAAITLLRDIPFINGLLLSTAELNCQLIYRTNCKTQALCSDLKGIVFNVS